MTTGLAHTAADDFGTSARVEPCTVNHRAGSTLCTAFQSSERRCPLLPRRLLMSVVWLMLRLPRLLDVQSGWDGAEAANYGSAMHADSCLP